MDKPIALEREQIQLLDEALRLAYTRLVDTGVARGHQFRSLRDPLIVPMIKAMLKGEKDVVRLARHGMFAAFDALAFGRLKEPDSRSTAEAPAALRSVPSPVSAAHTAHPMLPAS